jgi:hypothetical protein
MIYFVSISYKYLYDPIAKSSHAISTGAKYTFLSFRADYTSSKLHRPGSTVAYWWLLS